MNEDEKQNKIKAKIKKDIKTEKKWQKNKRFIGKNHSRHPRFFSKPEKYNLNSINLKIGKI